MLEIHRAPERLDHWATTAEAFQDRKSLLTTAALVTSASWAVLQVAQNGKQYIHTEHFLVNMESVQHDFSQHLLQQGIIRNSPAVSYSTDAITECSNAKSIHFSMILLYSEQEPQC